MRMGLSFPFLLLLFGFLFLNTMEFCSSKRHVEVNCLERERQALLRFKQGLGDLNGDLLSWRGKDCCKWSGVSCDNRTGNVIELHLSDLYACREMAQDACSSWGELNPSLLELKHLNSLNLSQSSFGAKPLPKFIGSFQELKYLDLSGTDFKGIVPNEIGNLSNLMFLDLSRTTDLEAANLHFLSGMPSLQYLDMSSVNLIKAHDWLNAVNMLPSLLVLRLSNCHLASPPSLSRPLFTSLSVLVLFDNQLGPRIPECLFNLSALVDLDLAACSLSGSIPSEFSKLKNLQHLNLQENSFHGPIPESLGRLPSLKELSLSNNNLNGSLQESLGQLSKLVTLELSYNSLEGNVSESYFANLKNLKSLALSANSLVLNVRPDWDPPFKLKSIRMRSCGLGPKFPAWLRQQRGLTDLDISSAQISGSIPDWFWKLSSQLYYLNLSHNEINGQIPKSLELALTTRESVIDLSFNKIEGPIPHTFPNSYLLDLSNNRFSGPIRLSIHQTSPTILSLSHNHLNGSIPRSLCKMEALLTLDLSWNQLTGEIPWCLGDVNELGVLDLSENNLDGAIPSSLGSMTTLAWLDLSNNKLSGDLPMSLRSLTFLLTMDLSGNRLSGSIPTWIGGSLQQLQILNLRSNIFSGALPPKLCNLTALQILDLANNNISGSIPSCFANFGAMATLEHRSEVLLTVNNVLVYEQNATVVTKGRVLDYTKTLYLVTNIDLSGNSLSGEIPKQIFSLLGLQSLNLSKNHLTGNIPSDIDGLQQLESLDLSWNQLSGVIPQRLSALNFLSSLDLSHNNLSGEIPSGPQLQTFNDPSIYDHNYDLCGPPLLKECTKNETSPAPGSANEEEEGEERFGWIWFYSSIALGFIIGFWGFCGSLLFMRPWRIAYYRFFDSLMGKVAVLLARCQSRE